MKIIKFKLFKSYSEEETWLNQQASAGWKLVKKGLFYTFQKSSQQQLFYSIDYRIFKNKADYQEYLNFYDSGWTHMAGSLRSGEHYFTTSNGQEKGTSIFSDRDSSALRYKKKAANSFQGVSAIICYLLMAHSVKIFDLKMIIHPERAFLTPGLWERSGEIFWQAFFFELPFALIFRILPIILLMGYLILLIIYWIWSVYGVKGADIS
jgi:hypothetical protein